MEETAKNQWQRARQIFEEALLKPAGERTRYARTICASNESLWAEVRSLLDWHESSESFLESPAVVQVVDNINSHNQLVSGQRLIHYEIQELIGVGGMGEVYLARDTRLHRNVAIKLLRRDLLPHIRTSERLLREARAAALLEHPNICHIYEVSEADGFSFIVMQYVVGTTLDELLLGDGIDPEKALDLALQIAEGLAEAHSQGIIHRDIKPANIIVSDKGQAKILDFGLAKFIEPETSADAVSRMESSGGVMGTVPYMSPEQLSGGSVDARTDVFSFGALLFEMLSGKPAFRRERNADTISAILKEEPDWSLISPVVRPLLKHCLEKDPSDRYPIASKLVEALAGAGRKRRQTSLIRSGMTQTIETEVVTGSTDVTTAPFALLRESQTHSRQTGSSGKGRNRIKRAIVVSILGVFALSFAILEYLGSFSISFGVSKDIENEGSASVPQPLYWTLPTARKRAFIRDRVLDIQVLIGDDQRPIDEGSIDGIMEQVDWYASRRNSLSQEPYKEGLRSIYGRASQYVSLISDEFQKANVPPVIGIYQAMVESEYRDCLVHDAGPVGLFQFTRRTGERYGMAHDDRCKVDKQSNAAARYMSDLLSEFGRENSSWTLSLLGFQQGADGTREQLQKLSESGIRERNYWAIAENRALFADYLESSDIYIRRFFAAAIIGETPERFDLVTPALSTIRTQTTSKVAMVAIPGGAFMMGRDDGKENEKPSHEETVKPFKMDKTEVTNAEFYEFVKATSYKPVSNSHFLAHWVNGRPFAGQENMSVRFVNIDDVNAYSQWRSEIDGAVYRLPTEQEWEFAARNGKRGNLFPWGDAFDPKCAFVDQGKSDPAPVGSKSCPNEWGAVDLIGNVYEWTSTTASLYPDSNGMTILSTDEPRYMVRGGGAGSRSMGQNAVTSTWRFDIPASKRSAEIGFRLVTEQ